MLAITKAIPQKQVEKHIEYEAQKLEAYKKAEERIKKSMLYMAGPEGETVRLEPEEVCRGMTEEELFPAIVSTAHALSEPGTCEDRRQGDQRGRTPNLLQ